MSAELAGMVLRCEKTGKLFFSHKEAELHGEETGLSDFSQVSMTETVWICAETGKVCFNEMQMDLHKKRVPEAKTFDAKTVADLKAMHEAKKAGASSSGGGEAMESEEELLLRQAGVKGKKRAPEEPAGPPVVTKETVDQLMEMGFTEVRAQKALVRTSNAGLEGAINWLTEHLEDADIDDPLTVGSDFEIKTQEELGQLEAERLAGSGSQLTAEEKKAKLEEALAKARAKKAGTTVEEEKEKEKARRIGGQALVASKREQEDQQRKRDMEARKREKREFELERQRLREKIEAEKAEKRANGLIVASAPAPAPAEAEKPAASKPTKPKTDAEAAAEAAAMGAAGIKRNYDEEELSLEAASEKLCALSEAKVKPALEMMTKMMANIAKSPADPKYRKLRLSNAKVAEGLVFVAGARQYLRALGWKLVETEFLELPVEGDGAAQATEMVAAVATLCAQSASAIQARNKAEMDERRKEAAEKAAKAKREREEMKAAMARDRAEVAARGPSQGSVARKLPSESGGTMTSAIFQEQEEAEGRRNAQ